MHRLASEVKTATLIVFMLALALVLGSACGTVPEKKNQEDAGCEVPTQEEACAGRCGDVVVCGASFSCSSDCTGELTCGGKMENTCGCASSPCAVTSFTAGDVNAQTLVDIAVDADGNVYAAGNFRGTVTFGSSSHTSKPNRPDMFLVKLSPAGEVLWSKAYGDLGTADSEQLVSAIDVDAAGNVVLVGSSYGPTNLGGADVGRTAKGDMVIVKLDKDGNHIFSAGYGTDFTIDPAAMSIDRASQDILVTGRFWGTLKFGTLASMTAVGTDSYFDIFLVRFSASGVPAYSRRYGDGAEQIPEAIATSGSHLYLSANFTGTYDYGAPNVTPVSSNSYTLALTKLGLGTFPHVWTKKYGTDVAGTQLAADAAGNVFVSGSFGGSLDIVTPPLASTAGDTFLAKLDPNGATIWAKQLANAYIASITTGGDGAIYVAGYVSGDIDLGGGSVTYSGTLDPFIAHYAADGTHLWSRVFPGAVGVQRAAAIAVGSGGTTWVGHNYEGTIDLGLGSVTTQGSTDIAIMGYVP